VSSKKYKDQTAKYTALQTQYNDCNSEKEKQATKISSLQSAVESPKENSTTLLNQLSTFSVVSQQQADNIRKSLENINEKDVYIQNMQIAMQKKDSLNLALVMNLKGALKNVNDEDVEVKVE